MRKIVRSAAEMQELAASFVPTIQPGTTMLLYGELGSGKTTFVQGLAKALGVQQPTTSPSFTITADYTTSHPKIKRLLHADLYRLLPEQALIDPAVQDMLVQAGSPAGLTVVEWADRLGDNIPDGALSIMFEHGDAVDERHITIRE